MSGAKKSLPGKSEESVFSILLIVAGLLITWSWLPLFVFVFCHLSSWEANEPAAVECDLAQSEIWSFSKRICVKP